MTEPFCMTKFLQGQATEFPWRQDGVAASIKPRDAAKGACRRWVFRDQPNSMLPSENNLQMTGEVMVMLCPSSHICSCGWLERKSDTRQVHQISPWKILSLGSETIYLILCTRLKWEQTDGSPWKTNVTEQGKQAWGEARREGKRNKKTRISGEIPIPVSRPPETMPCFLLKPPWISYLAKFMFILTKITWSKIELTMPVARLWHQPIYNMGKHFFK